MAEGHNVSALSFSITHDGVSVSYDQELLRDIWHAFTRAYKRRVNRFKNDFYAGIFPASPKSLLFTVCVITGFSLLRLDVTWGLVPWFRNKIFSYVFGTGLLSTVISTALCSIVLWFALIQVIRISLKMLLSYRGWMYEAPHERPMSRTSKAWLGVLHLISKSEPMTHSFQGALPHLPLPSLDQTLTKHLTTQRPLLSDKEYDELVRLSEEFKRGIGNRLQRYLTIKYYLSINYVTDWWEEFIYLRQRSPIMVNSNYYGVDTLFMHPTDKQAARAANTTWAALQFRRMVERQEVSPFAISQRYKVPFCTMQYERLFNSCRIPGEESDTFKHWDDSKYVAVLCNGCWYRLQIHSNKRLLEPAELQRSFQYIIDRKPDPCEGEIDLACLTAGERTPWAKARKEYFSRGINKTSLHAIEKAAFVVVLDDEPFFKDETDEQLDHWAKVALHGNCNNRWFDKSFNIIVATNGRICSNAEHSWGDAAVTAHFIEYMILKDKYVRGYTETGDCHGTAEMNLVPTRLKWDLPAECLSVIASSKLVAEALVADVDLTLLMWTEFGKGYIKKLKVSPDAFIQMALQLTYFRNQGHFCLTYEASMTRLFREGRTETVRTVTTDSCAFVRAMLDPDATREERVRLLRVASASHQNQYRDAMCGSGTDRHLFALYIVKRYLEVDSPFFDRIFPPTYTLSTSQTPLQQTTVLDLAHHQEFATAGGGFGPVSDNGYGVSYIVVGENTLTFHVSSKLSAETTSSARFKEDLKTSLRDMRALFHEGPKRVPSTLL